MKTTAKKSIKQQLLDHCITYVARHIEINRSAVSDAQAAVIEETKNTAGDRYETERAMKQREAELFGKRLDESLKMEKALLAIDGTGPCSSVRPGALVSTSLGDFFVAISADEVVIDDKEYSVISSESPVYLAMAGKAAGERFVFRDKTVRITDVC